MNTKNNLNCMKKKRSHFHCNPVCLSSIPPKKNKNFSGHSDGLNTFLPFKQWLGWKQNMWIIRETVSVYVSHPLLFCDYITSYFKTKQQTKLSFLGGFGRGAECATPLMTFKLQTQMSICHHQHDGVHHQNPDLRACSTQHGHFSSLGLINMWAGTTSIHFSATSYKLNSFFSLY